MSIQEQKKENQLSKKLGNIPPNTGKCKNDTSAKTLIQTIYQQMNMPKSVVELSSLTVKSD